jgi:hypothetical protein
MIMNELVDVVVELMLRFSLGIEIYGVRVEVEFVAKDGFKLSGLSESQYEGTRRVISPLTSSAVLRSSKSSCHLTKSTATLE